MKTKFIPVSSIQTDGLQVRVSTDNDVVTEYQEAVKEGARLPPIAVYANASLPNVYFLADGFHRLTAALRSGAKEIEATINEGGHLDALRAALAANASHGLRRTRADKLNAIKKAWENRAGLFGTDRPSAREIARACNVDNHTVASWMGVNCPESRKPVPPPPVVQGGEFPTPYYTETPPLVEEGEEAPVTHQASNWQEFYNAAEAEPIEAPEAPNAMEAEAVLDNEGRLIPPEKIATWNARRELNRLSLDVCEIERAVKALLDAKNPIMIGFNASAFFAEADKLKSRLHGHLPHAVCPYCQGLGGSSCTACKGRGFVTKTQWTSGIPAELKG